MSKLVLRCWNKGHVVEVEIPKSKVGKFLEQCRDLKKVCPHCKPENKHLQIISNDTDSFCEYKPYQCPQGHLTLVSTFGRTANMLAVTWGAGSEDRKNIQGTTEELGDMVDKGQVVCHHCSEKLTACDETQLSYAEFSNFKTKTRVEDVWRKYKAAEPKVGSYDEKVSDPRNPVLSKYNATEFEIRNKERLKRMQRRRNISEDRLPGKPIE